jgi:tRNA threonylcarbamoyladenosine biosynthesis protein TsaB
LKILALELSSKEGSVAWLDDGRTAFVRGFANDRKHSGAFFENLRSVSQQFGAPSAIVVGLGPGSYAGVRIAIAAAVGLRVASHAKLYGMASICAIETEASDYCAIGDARRESFFFGRIRSGRVVEGPLLYSSNELSTRLAELTGPFYASESLPLFPGATLAFPSARRLAELTYEQIDEMAEAQSLEPIYLREPFITTPRTPLSGINR